MIKNKMLDKDAKIIFNDEKTFPKKKSKFKRILILLLTLFILANLFMYIGFYNNYVSTSPKGLKKARKEMIKAHIFSMYEVLAIKLGFDFRNPILKPLQNIKEYFYNKGLDKFSNTEGERAYWFGQLMFYPIDLSMNSKKMETGSVAKNYGVEFATKYLENLYINLELLSKYSVSDYENKYIKDKLVWIYFMMFSSYVDNYHLIENNILYSNEALLEIRNSDKFLIVKNVYDGAKLFFRNKRYKKEFNKDILEEPRREREFYKTFFNTNTRILYHLMFHQMFRCNNKIGEVLIIDFKRYKINLERIIDEKNLDLKNLSFLLSIIKTKFIKQEQKIINQCNKGKNDG